MRQSNKKQSQKQKGGILTWVVFAVILAGLFGALIVWQKQRGAEEGKTPEAAQEPGKKFAEEELSERQKQRRDQQGLSDALAKGSDKACAAIADEALKNQCEDSVNFPVFINGGDEKKCLLLHDTALQSRCADQIFYRLAIEDGSVEWCEKIVDALLQENCRNKTGAAVIAAAEETRYRQAASSIDPASCAALLDPILKANCETAVARNKAAVTAAGAEKTEESTAAMLEECDVFSGAEAAACQDGINFRLALEKKDLSYCGKITDPARKNECLRTQGGNLNRFYLKQALVKKDPVLCEKITDSALKESCLKNTQQ